LLRHSRGLTQRQLARDLGISQNYVPAIEANARQAGAKPQQRPKYFGAPFEAIFDLLRIDPDTGRERPLSPRN
jgi:transcriptional regulator with XRE-family HTH domain